MKSILQVISFDLVSKALLGITGIILIRFMAQTEYAQYTLAISLVMVVTQAFATSLNRLYIVGYQRLKLESSSSSFLGFQLVGIILLSVLALPFASSFKGIYWFIVVAVVATCFSEFSKTFFQEKLKFLHFSFIEIGRTFLLAIGVILAIVIFGKSLCAYQVILIQAAAMGVVFLAVFSRKLELANLFRFREVISLASTIIRGEYKFLFIYFFLFAFFGQLDVFMLRGLANDVTLATYGSAFRYYTLVIMALGSVNNVFLPVTQKIDDIQKLRATFKRYLKLAAVIAPVILLGAWASRWIIPVIDAGKYPQAVTVFRILAVSAVISIALSPFVNLVMKYEKFRFLFLTVLGAIVISAGLNLLLVPGLGAVGTAISTLISFGLVNGVVFLKAIKLLRIKEPSEINIILDNINTPKAPEAISV